MRHSTLIILPLLTFTGCGAATEDESTVDTGESEQAVLGDILCASSSNTDRYYASSCDLEGGDTCYYGTPNGNYGNDFSSGEDCNPYMTMDVNTAGFTAMTVNYAADRGEALPTNQTDCVKMRLEVAGYSFDNNGNQFVFEGKTTSAATWSGGSCHLSVASFSSQLTCGIGMICQESPIVTGRYYKTGFLEEAKRVILYMWRQ